jgi:hypothetical protein
VAETLVSPHLDFISGEYGATRAARHSRRGDRRRSGLLRCMSPLLAQSGRPTVGPRCPLLGVKRTSRLIHAMSAFDPLQTSGDSHFLRPGLTRYDALS